MGTVLEFPSRDELVWRAVEGALAVGLAQNGLGTEAQRRILAYLRSRLSGIHWVRSVQLPPDFTKEQAAVFQKELEQSLSAASWPAILAMIGMAIDLYANGLLPPATAAT